MGLDATTLSDSEIRPHNYSFFLYGSLAKGQIHFQKFFGAASHVEKNVFVKGNVYRLEVGFPILHLGTSGEPNARMIPGDLVTCHLSDLMVNILDEFHGFSRSHPEKSLYIRHEVDVFLDDGRTQKGFVYAINPLKIPRSSKLIENGNWMQDLVNTPPLTASLIDRERDYIRRLGQSSGRDIVPIQLDLYRHLMNMGIIVDKGRRLALTKLGQDVFRFLE